MKIEIDVPEYSTAGGLRIEWDDCFRINVRTSGDEVVIVGNPAGLRSLARHLLTLAQDGVPQHHHVHLDEFNALEDGSAALILERSEA